MTQFSGFYQFVSTAGIDPSYSPRYIDQVYFADLNGDGKMDMFVTGGSFNADLSPDAQPQPGRVAFGDGKGGFTVADSKVFPWDSLLTVQPRKILFSDLNGDGRLDVFVACHGWDTSPFPGEQNRLYLSQLDGTWRDATATLPQFSDFSHSAAIGDINRDGFPDIYVGNIDAQYHIAPYVLVNDGKGGFKTDGSLIPASTGQILSFANVQSISSSMFDLDGDGSPELVLGNWKASSSNPTGSLVFWNTNGRYDATAMTALPQSHAYADNNMVHDIQAADINGDGLQDLIVAVTDKGNGGQMAQGWTIQLLVNKGGHVFADETASRIGATDSSGGSIWPLWIKVIDFNGDGASDFFVQMNGQHQLTDPLIWLNDGTGRFSTLKVGDFFDDSQKSHLDGSAIVQTDNGWSFVETFLYTSAGKGLSANTLLAANPFFTGPDGIDPSTLGAPGYNEQYYLNEHPDVVQLVAQGKYTNGLDHYLKAGKAAGYNAFAPNMTIHCTAGSTIVAGREGNETFIASAANYVIDGGAGSDTVVFSGNRNGFTLADTVGSDTANDKSGVLGTYTLKNIERIKFADMTVNLTVGAAAKSISATDLKSLEELYVAFFNRVPDADGLGYWIGQFKAGRTLDQISDSFYDAAIYYSSLTGYSASMTNTDFVKIIYKNVLGRSGDSAPPDADVSYWAGELANGHRTRGSLIGTMLDSAHSFKGDQAWGWVTNLLDNKVAVANYFAVQQGLNYNSSSDSITKGMAIAAAVTATDTAAAITLIGVSDAGFTLT